jgi:hypothetical protein
MPMMRGGGTRSTLRSMRSSCVRLKSSVLASRLSLVASRCYLAQQCTKVRSAARGQMS